MKQDKIGLRSFLVVVATLALVLGCSRSSEVIMPETKHVVIDRAAPVPPGVVRYCWEEPMVQFEPNGPGLNTEGTWYEPSYIAVREVRMGRWRPCRSMPSEVKGETKNER